MINFDHSMVAKPMPIPNMHLRPGSAEAKAKGCPCAFDSINQIILIDVYCPLHAPGTTIDDEIEPTQNNE